MHAMPPATVAVLLAVLGMLAPLPASAQNCPNGGAFGTSTTLVGTDGATYVLYNTPQQQRFAYDMCAAMSQRGRTPTTSLAALREAGESEAIRILCKSCNCCE